MFFLRGILTLTLFFSFTLRATAVELELKESLFVEAPFELSGTRVANDQILFVSDDDSQPQIFKLSKKPARHNLHALDVFIDLRKLSGFVQIEANLKKSKSRFDLEGITNCASDYYIANERARLIHHVTAKSIETIPLDWEPFKDELAKGGDNAGFEGVAVDCTNQILYVAKERQPRMIYVWDLKTNKFIEKFDIDNSDRMGQKVLNYETGYGLLEIARDFADLYFEKNALYALERNTREITKIDPQSKKILERHSYLRSEWGLYDTPMPFGLAEGLAMDDGFIYLAFDNNHAALSQETQKKQKVKGFGGVVMKFARPEKF